MLTVELVEFWYVWTKTGHKPHHKHDTEAEACHEATRLAILNPGKKFIILKAQTKFCFSESPA